MFKLDQKLKKTYRGLTEECQVIQVVPSGQMPDLSKLNPSEVKFKKLETNFSSGWAPNPRDHESYLVIIQKGKTAKSKPTVFWPFVNSLEAIIE